MNEQGLKDRLQTISKEKGIRFETGAGKSNNKVDEIDQRELESTTEEKNGITRVINGL